MPEVLAVLTLGVVAILAFARTRERVDRDAVAGALAAFTRWTLGGVQ